VTVRTVTISGTDPTNPRNAKQVFTEVAAIAAAADGAAERLLQLRHFAGAIRDVLLDQGVPPRQADDRTGEVVRAFKAAAERTEEASAAMAKANQMLVASGVIMQGSFEWRPGVPGRR
jgi:hypothetical protein